MSYDTSESGAGSSPSTPSTASKIDAQQETRDAEHDYLRTEFPSRIAHDIRSPLGIISGTLAELRRSADTANGQLLELTERALCQLQRIADRLSLIARLEGNRLECAIQPVELASILEQARAEISQTRRRRSVSVDFQLPSDAITVPCDPRLLQRACEELLDNAVRHAQERVLVSARHGADRLVLEFSDDGTPTPALAQADHRGELFTRFLADGSRSGLGLGLSIARDIAMRHGGTVTLTRTDPTTFRLELPRST